MRDATKEEKESIHKYIKSISEPMIPLSVIDEIKAEIINESNKAFHAPNWDKARGLDLARDIIEEKVKEYKHG